MQKNNILLSLWCFFEVKSLFVCWLFLANFANAQSNSWPHIRGPEYNGHAVGGNIEIASQQQFPIIWRTKTGQGFSGCVVAHGKVFTQAQNRSGQYVICLDATTGKELWRTRYGWPWELNGQYPGTYSTPTWNNGKIYFTGCYGESGCLDAATGRKIWSEDLVKKFAVEIPSFGYACTPLLDSGRMYLNLGKEGGSIFALKASDGSFIWKAGEQPASYSSPIVISVSGHRQIISFLENVLVASDPETGRELWNIQISEGYDEHSAWPVFADPYLFCASPFFRDARVVELSYVDQAPVCKTEWQRKVMSNDIFSSVIVDGFVYGFNIAKAQANPIGQTKGSFKCVELKTGKERWQTEATGHVNVMALGNKLILLSDNGTLIIAESDPGQYREITRQKIFKGVKCWTMPAFCDGKLYLRGGQEIVCIDLVGRLISPAEGTGPEVSQSFGEIVDNWLHQYKDDAFVAPSYHNMRQWYWFSLAVMVMSALLAFAAGHLMKHTWSLFLILASGLGFFGPLIFSPLTGEFIFTWPVSLYAVFLSVLQTRAAYLKKNVKRSPYFTRIILGLFILFCLGFYQLCLSLFIISGIGFLAGLIPLTPLALLIPRFIEQKIRLKPLLAAVAAFSVYYWISGVFIVFRT